MNQILPITLTDKNIFPYAGFWRRLGAHLIDILMIIPYMLIFFYLQKSNYLVLIFLFFFAIAFQFFWSIYLLKRFGGTPGKLICGVRVIRQNGMQIRWKEAFLRNIVDFPYLIYTSIFNLWFIHHLGYEIFQSLSFMGLGEKVMESNLNTHTIVQNVYQVWFWSELIVLLFNKRKRALHDFIASTIVIKKSALPLIENHIKLSPNQ